MLFDTTNIQSGIHNRVVLEDQPNSGAKPYFLALEFEKIGSVSKNTADINNKVLPFDILSKTGFEFSYKWIRGNIDNLITDTNSTFFTKTTKTLTSPSVEIEYNDALLATWGIDIINKSNTELTNIKTKNLTTYNDYLYNESVVEKVTINDNNNTYDLLIMLLDHYLFIYFVLFYLFIYFFFLYIYIYIYIHFF